MRCLKFLYLPSLLCAAMLFGIATVGCPSSASNLPGSPPADAPTPGDSSTSGNSIPPDSSSGDAGSGLTLSECVIGQRPTVDPAAVLAILTRYRDPLADSVRADVRAAVEEYVQQFPVDPSLAPAIQSSAAPETGEDIFDVDPGRRDWAYAVNGLPFTLAASEPTGGRAWLDLGMWCFLEAALLVPDEPEHLVNVAFHLNVRGEFDDARQLLFYALELDPQHLAAAENLAYTYEQQQSWACAIAILQDEVLPRGLPDGDVVGRLVSAYRALGAVEPANDFESLLGDVPSDGFAQALTPSGDPRFFEVFEELNRVYVAGGYSDRIAAIELSFIGLGEPARCGSGPAPGNGATDAIFAAWNACRDAVLEASLSENEQRRQLCECDLALESRFVSHDSGATVANSSLALRKNVERQEVVRQYRADLLNRINAADLQDSDRAFLTDFFERSTRALSLGFHNGALREVSGGELCVQEQRREFSTQAAICSLLPATAPQQVLFAPFTLNLGIAKVSVSSNLTLKVTIGQGIQVFAEFNPITDRVALGGGLGVSFGSLFNGKLFSTQAYFKVRPSEGLELGVKLDVATPTGSAKSSGSVINPKVLLFRNARPEVPPLTPGSLSP